MVDRATINTHFGPFNHGAATQHAETAWVGGPQRGVAPARAFWNTHIVSPLTGNMLHYRAMIRAPKCSHTLHECLCPSNKGSRGRKVVVARKKNKKKKKHMFIVEMLSIPSWVLEKVACVFREV